MIVYLKTSSHRHCFNIFIYYFIKIGETLSEDVMISSHAVNSEVECSVKCLEKSTTCVGYNYKPVKSNRYTVNCQLSNKTRGKDQAIGANKKWEFYQNFKKVRIKEYYILVCETLAASLQEMNASVLLFLQHLFHEKS